MPTFSAFAGQEVADGIANNYPVVDFEEANTRAAYSGLSLIHGLLPKIGKTIIRETRVFESPLDRIFRKTALPFGVGFEDFEFAAGANNKKKDGTCVPLGTPGSVNQLNLLNVAWSIDVSIKDREVNMAVTTPEEAGAYAAQKLRTPLKTLGMFKYRLQNALISDVIDGTRTIASTDNSNGTGTTVNYNPTVTGYAGAVEDLGFVLAPLQQGTQASFAQASDALDMIKAIENAATEMKEEGTYYSKLQVNTFTLDKPWLVMEAKTLNAIDAAWAMDGAYQGVPTRTAREYLSRFADVVEIPGAFEDLPTSQSYTNKRLAAVLLDKDSATMATAFDDVESQRCAKERLTGYNWSGSIAMSIYRGNPACAFIADTQ